jgi:hypothetical protein
MGYGFRSDKGKSIVAYWLAAHSYPGNVFPPLYATFTFKNTGIKHPVLVDVVSGEIKPLSWKAGTTDTLDGLPVKDSIMAVADADYFDWPILPEAPSSLNISIAGNSAKLNWEVHGGNPTNIVVERKVENGDGAMKKTWTRIAKLPSSATEYSDSSLKKGDHYAFRVRAVNSDGDSAYSNVARGAVAMTQ